MWECYYYLVKKLKLLDLCSSLGRSYVVNLMYCLAFQEREWFMSDRIVRSGRYPA